MRDEDTDSGTVDQIAIADRTTLVLTPRKTAKSLSS
jgi:hypothetical protein